MSEWWCVCGCYFAHEKPCHVASHALVGNVCLVGSASSRVNQQLYTVSGYDRHSRFEVVQPAHERLCAKRRYRVVANLLCTRCKTKNETRCGLQLQPPRTTKTSSQAKPG